jgi:hypothetical protein
MSFIPLSYWGSGNCSAQMPTSSLAVYYNVNSPSCYEVNSSVLYNLVDYASPYTASTSATYSFSEGALDLRAKELNTDMIVNFNNDTNVVSCSIMLTGKFSQPAAGVNYYLLRDVNGTSPYENPGIGQFVDGFLCFGPGAGSGSYLGFEWGVYKCATMPTSSVAGYTTNYNTIAITYDLTNGILVYNSSDNFTVPYAEGGGGLCASVNRLVGIMQNAGYFRAFAKWDKALSVDEIRQANIAMNCAGNPVNYNPISNQLITNGLVAWLGCDSLTGSIWYDKSGNNNHALISGSALTYVGGNNGWKFNGSYTASLSNYLTFPNPLNNSPVNNTTLVWYGKNDSSSSNQYLFRKGWTRFGYLSGSFGWDSIYGGQYSYIDVRTATSYDNNLSGYVYNTSSAGMFSVTIQSGSDMNTSNPNLKLYVNNSYIQPTETANWGAPSQSNFIGSGSAAGIPLTFGYADVITQCQEYLLNGPASYAYYDCNNNPTTSSVIAGQQINICSYPNKPVYKVPGFTLQGGSTGYFCGTPSPTPSEYYINLTGDAFPYRGTLSNILVYNRVLSDQEAFSNYQWLSSNNNCA